MTKINAAWDAKYWTPEIGAMVEDLDERQSIADQAPHRSFGDIKNLERLATDALKRSERFRGEHRCASAVFSTDIPKYEAIARAHTPIETAPRIFRKLR